MQGSGEHYKMRRADAVTHVGTFPGAPMGAGRLYLLHLGSVTPGASACGWPRSPPLHNAEKGGAELTAPTTPCPNIPQRAAGPT